MLTVNASDMVANIKTVRLWKLISLPVYILLASVLPLLINDEAMVEEGMEKLVLEIEAVSPLNDITILSCPTQYFLLKTLIHMSLESI